MLGNFSALAIPNLGTGWAPLLLQLYPWFFGFASVGFLKVKGFIPLVGPMRLWISGILSLVNLALFFMGFGYEGQIYQEMLIPTIVFFPHLRRMVKSLSRLGLILLPMIVIVLVEQIKATQFDQWSYLLEGNRYLFWARQNGSVLERLVWFGGQDYPLAELEFYVLYIVGTFTYLCAAVCIFPKHVRASKKLKWFFPMTYSIPLAILFPLGVWYMFIRHSIPVHAVTAGLSVVLFWIFFQLSFKVREFLASPLFVVVTIFSFFQTAIFETYHVARGHWYYKPALELAGLAPWLHWTFPSLPSLGISPRSWPIEEFCAYPGLWPFIYCMVLWANDQFQMDVFKPAERRTG